VRICLASIHPRVLSGQIEGLIALRQGLEELGHSVQLVSAFGANKLRQPRRWAIDFGDSSSLASKVTRVFGILPTIAVAARGCDVVHFNVPTPAFSALADLVQFVSRRPTVVGFEAHLPSVPALTRRLRHAPAFYAPRMAINNGLVARATLRRASGYVVSSGLQRRELLSLGYDSRRLHVIPNLIDGTKLGRLPHDEARAALGLPADPLVGFVGHFHDVKGHDILIDAFPMVLRDVPEARLVIAWSGIGDRRAVRAAIARAGIAHRVIELGRVDVGHLFSAVDVVALPYRFSIGQAAFPGTVLEAMTVGVPLVTTRLPLLIDLTENGRTALLARPEDPGDLSRQIVLVLRQSEVANGIVEAQRVAMAERFNPTGLLQDYVGVYEQARVL
jgi:glycosyltransferase involved in cell wall biosynthesis